ncbi:MAG: prenyltransferase [Phototrophicales bacterium]|nr:prenyltransferase [Phototrophicales bacterium]
MESVNAPTPQTQNILKGIISLSRWKEQMPLISLTFLGGLIAHGVINGITLDWRLFVVAIANFLTVTFAFMINDMEDAEDDAANPISAKRNPITNGTLDLHTAWIACGGVVLLALIFYLIGGWLVLIIGAINLTLSFLYSWKPVRLKSSTVGLDVVSHTLMLGGLLPLAGYFAYTTEIHPTIILVTLATILGSTYGQLYNQVRDFDADKRAGIMNVTIRVGEKNAFLLMYGAIIAAVIGGVIGVILMGLPEWLLPTIAVCIAFGVAMTFLFVQTDSSGKPPLDITGRLQVGFWVAFNLVMAIWVLWAML